MTRWSPDAEYRLTEAAITLFDKHGYDETTVAEIAESAGLTKRTFFRYFTDKREVLFKGSPELQNLWVQGIHAAAPDASPMAAVAAGLDEVAELFTDRHPFAKMRSRIVAANPELQERELIKLQKLAAAIEEVLVERGLSADAAALASQTGVTIFHVAFARWVKQDDPAALKRITHELLTELRSVVAN